MAMTAEVKDELSRLVVNSVSARRAEVAALLRFAGGLHIVSGRVVVEAEVDLGIIARRLRKIHSAAFQQSPIAKQVRYAHHTPTGTAMTCTASKPRQRPNNGACTCAAVLAAAGPPSRVCRMTKNELMATGKKANRPEAKEPIE